MSLSKHIANHAPITGIVELAKAFASQLEKQKSPFALGNRVRIQVKL